MIIEVYCTKNIFLYFDTPVNLNHRIFMFNLACFDGNFKKIAYKLEKKL